MKNVRLGDYCDWSTNAKYVVINEAIKIYFSYETPIAFILNGELTIRQNDWSITTGKHLNAINSNKEVRINSEEFNQVLESAVKIAIR